jgi:hypothetical protein
MCSQRESGVVKLSQADSQPSGLQLGGLSHDSVEFLCLLMAHLVWQLICVLSTHVAIPIARLCLQGWPCWLFHPKIFAVLVKRQGLNYWHHYLLIFHDQESLYHIIKKTAEHVNCMLNNLLNVKVIDHQQWLGSSIMDLNMAYDSRNILWISTWYMFIPHTTD